MTSVADMDLGNDYAGEAAGASGHLLPASLDGDLTTVQAKFNELLDAVGQVIRDDDTLVDGIVYPRHLAQTVYDLFAGDEDLTRLEVVETVAVSNLTLSGEQTVSWVTTSTSRVLLTGQTDPTENGVWVTAAGAWSRATDMAAADTLSGYYLVQVDGGSYRLSRWELDATAADLTVGTDGLTFTRTGLGCTQDRLRFQSIPSELTMSPEIDDGNYIYITLPLGSCLINLPSGLVAGMRFFVEVTQGGSGGRRIYWGTGMSGARPPMMTAGAVTVYQFVAESSSLARMVSMSPDTSAVVNAYTDAYLATVTPDMRSGNYLRITLTGDVTFNLPDNLTAGDRYYIEVTQDAAGGHSVSWGAGISAPGSSVDTVMYTTTLFELVAVSATLVQLVSVQHA